jgi:hypothetical protein
MLGYLQIHEAVHTPQDIAQATESHPASSSPDSWFSYQVKPDSLVDRTARARHDSPGQGEAAEVIHTPPDGRYRRPPSGLLNTAHSLRRTRAEHGYVSVDDWGGSNGESVQ